MMCPDEALFQENGQLQASFNKSLGPISWMAALLKGPSDATFSTVYPVKRCGRDDVCSYHTVSGSSLQQGRPGNCNNIQQ